MKICVRVEVYLHALQTLQGGGGGGKIHASVSSLVK